MIDPSVLSSEDHVEIGATTLSGIPIRNVWHMLLYAWGEAAAVERWQREAEAAPSLDALLASVLLRLVEQRLRVGLGRGYDVEAASIRGIRGRIDFAQSLKTLEFERGKAYCRFHAFTADIPRNRTIRAVLDRLAKAGEFGPLPGHAAALRQRLRRLVRDLDEITPVSPRPGVAARETTGRNDGDYRLMLAICELVLRRQMPTEAGGAGSLGINRDTLTLHAVFERFVATFLRARLSGWHVQSQKVLAWPTSGTPPLLPTMQADLVLQEVSTGRIVLLDTKFTAASLVANRFGEHRLDSSHLYQIYAYLRSQEEFSAAHRYATGILLYPAAAWHLSERMEVQGHLIRVETVDLTRPWPEVENRLLAAVRDEEAGRMSL
ncbi:5-methylcytosine restriction system specificity protein McrC [Pseudoroseomonas ludipueritiae]|uniref:5-methylcytosine-specific restriction enzyme subunit McrC n=1 Tax=Pseudoroseomonas ludipueritiae TaxID=198093 RepID=A0ABR7R8L0_9PROT|nr:hypothetical protein [Pseudoroseomonas ludipueritiae]MCG7360585.1 hypothetical protein [Roseomonas sp. ACRSG]